MRITNILKDRTEGSITITTLTDRRFLGIKLKPIARVFTTNKEYMRGYWSWVESPHKTPVSGTLSYDLNEWVKLYLIDESTKNPIKDNRIVKDKTFALRLLNFALSTNCSDPCQEDEKESMVSYSTSLLRYQIETAIDKEEREYLIRCNATAELKKGLRFLKNS